MKRLPEGMRRLCAVIGVLCVTGWIATIGFLSDGFTHVAPMGWVFVGLVAFLAYVLPALIFRIYRWVKDGFAMDGHEGRR